MFMKIKTNQASEIYIAIPSGKVGFAQNMIDVFEKNAVFINSGYSTVDIVKPTITLELGNEVDLNKDNDSQYITNTVPDFKIRMDGVDVVENYEEATPEVLASMKKALEHTKNLLDRERKKVSCLESQVTGLGEEVEDLKKSEGADDY